MVDFFVNKPFVISDTDTYLFLRSFFWFLRLFFVRHSFCHIF
jgi:hypothetical protein